MLGQDLPELENPKALRVRQVVCHAELLLDME